VLRSLTVTDWLLILVLLALWGVASAIRWGFASLIQALEPVIDHYRGIEERHQEREMIGDLLKAGVATPEDIDRLNRLDAEEREERRP
jgi:hypothetical protein